MNRVIGWRGTGVQAIGSTRQDGKTVLTGKRTHDAGRNFNPSHGEAT